MAFGRRNIEGRRQRLPWRLGVATLTPLIASIGATAWGSMHATGLVMHPGEEQPWFLVLGSLTIGAVVGAVGLVIGFLRLVRKVLDESTKTATSAKAALESGAGVALTYLQIQAQLHAAREELDKAKTGSNVTQSKTTGPKMIDGSQAAEGAGSAN